MNKISNLFKVLWDSDTGEFIYSNINYDVETTGYLHVQNNPSTEWIINHKKNNLIFVYQVFSEDREIIIPESVVIVDLNSIKINFNEAVTGLASIFFVTDTLPPTLITATPTPTPTITPTISVTPSMTPTVTPTPSITPTISVTPSEGEPLPSSLPPIEVTPTPTPSGIP